ncbi:LapA family protein [Metabacillus kandeliae]|uniref:LapA family protein n=1 Tax=Metabacillus kandeliae TaxID=2900151 RepID=UPI0038CC0742
MKRQWSIILTIIFALIVAIFAVNNVSSVSVNFLFGQTRWPLILIILGSVLMGGLLLGSTGMFRTYSLKRRVKELEKENDELKIQIEKHRTAESTAAAAETETATPIETEEALHEHKNEPSAAREAEEEQKISSANQKRQSRMERHR